MLRSFFSYFFSVRFELCFSFVHISTKGILLYTTSPAVHSTKMQPKTIGGKNEK